MSHWKLGSTYGEGARVIVPCRNHVANGRRVQQETSHFQNPLIVYTNVAEYFVVDILCRYDINITNIT